MSQPFDLTRMTREDLFRAKEERRKRLANLPFEEKIAIVKKLNDLSLALKPIRDANRLQIQRKRENASD